MAANLPTADLASLHGKAVPGHPTLQYWGKNGFIRVRIQITDPDIRKIVGKPELVKGLGTQCVNEAVRRARIPAAEFESRIAEAYLQIGKSTPRTVIYLSMPRMSTAAFGQMLLGMNRPGENTELRFTDAPKEEAIPLAGFHWEAGIELWVSVGGDAPPSEETIDVYTSHMRRFMNWVGSDLMNDVTDEHFADYPLMLSKVVDDKKAADGGRALANKSINNNMASIRRVFRVAASKKKITTDPSVGTVHKLKVRKNVMKDRKSFDRDQHAQIIAAALALPKDDPRRWLWLLGAIYGGRISEFADAKVSAIRIVHGRVCFDINEEYRNVWNGKPLSLKNEGSPRVLPLIQFVRDSGFLEYVETIRARDADGPLFPMLRVSKYGKRRDHASDMCIAWMRDLLSTDDRRLVFHSTRHTVKTFLRGNVSDQLSDAITGHDEGSTSFHYGETELGVMVEKIEAYIPLPVAA